MNHSSPIAIIGAMPQEVSTLSARLEAMTTNEAAGVVIYSGLLDGVPVVVTQSGIGKVNATIATALVIERFSPRMVINTGSAGGIGDGLAVGDVIIGHRVAHHDVDVTAFGYQMGQMAQMPVDYPSDDRLIAVAQDCAKVFPNATVHSGQIVSGDQFVADTQRFNTIRTWFPQAVAVEMEAAAIAQTCYQFDLPFVVIRAVSDLANEDASISFDEFVEQAGKHSAEMVIAMVSSMR